MTAEPGAEQEFHGAAALAASTLALVQAQADLGIDAPLWCATRLAVATGDGDVPADPARAVLWGLGRTVAQEQPQLWGGLVDLPGEPDESASALLGAALAGADGEDQLAVRGTRVLARRLVRDTRPPRADESWTPKGAVLVVGAVEPGLVSQLAAMGAPRVVLATAFDPDFDPADRSAAADLLARAQADGPISALLYAAGPAPEATVDRLDPAELARSLHGALAGAAHFDELTRDLHLDAFVLLGSVAGVFGLAGRAGQGAADAHAEALAAARHAAGLPGVSLGWGPWQEAAAGENETGTGTEPATATAAEHLRAAGLATLDPGAAADGLIRALDRGSACAVVADVDWERFVPAFTSARPSALLLDLPEAVRAGLSGDGHDGAAPLREQLAGLTAEQQERALSDLVRSRAAATLGHPSVAAVPAQSAFRELGFDSLTAIDLRNRLGAATGLRLPTTLVFDHPSAAAIGRYLRTLLFSEDESSSGGVGARYAADEPIAVIGMSCRFPGGVRSPEEFWELISSERDAISDFPVDRGWDRDGVYDPTSQRPGTSYTVQGGFLHDATGFDAAFFGISPREALAMDPQQRVLLEVAWETVERTGTDPASLRGARVGVFAGVTTPDYSDLLREAGEELEGYVMTGNVGSVVSGRVSYTLGFEGPAISVDTACSSSLVAIHLACQSLRQGECELALAGGVTVMSTPGAFVEFSRQGGLSPDGRCKSFAAAADGTGWGEGAGMIALERLSDAVRNGRRILGVVRGSAVNQDGASNGLTAPNGPSQQRVIRAALAGARLAAEDVDVVEGHGTGTRLGDPIEAQALLATYGRDRPAERPLWLGSVKSNIGHTSAAAGVAGVIKMLMAIRHGLLPRTLHVDAPTDQVDWDEGAVRLLAEAQPWPEQGRPRRAGISAFGFSGTNAHLIVEQAVQEPAVQEQTEAAPIASAPAAEVDAAPTASGPAALILAEGAVLPWVLSARGESALRGQAGRLAGAVAAEPRASMPVPVPVALADLGYSLAATRSVFDRRAVVFGADREELAAELEQLASGVAGERTVRGEAGDDRAVFVFPGQGSQWVGMAAQLLESSPVFARRLAECEQALAPYLDWSLREALVGGDGAPSLDRVDVVQPALFAVMVSLAAVWEALGVSPAAVVGHSQGEIAAACVAGALSLEDAARVVAVRSRILLDLAGTGAMASVATGRQDLAELLESFDGALSIAAANGPHSTVVSGDPSAMEEFLELCAARELRARRIAVDYASHAQQVEAIKDRLLSELGEVSPRAARIPLLSTVVGRWLEPGELDAEYWYRNLRQTVRFEEAITSLVQDGFELFIEVSPHPVLVTGMQETVEAAGVSGTVEAAGGAAVLGTLRRDDGGAERFVQSAAEAFVHGAPVRWAELFGGARPVDLPTYSFQHQRFWPAAPVRRAGQETGLDPADASFWSVVEGGDAASLADTLGIERGAVSDSVIGAMAAWRSRTRELSAALSWRYRIDWVPFEAGPPAGPGTWLVVRPAGTSASAPWAAWAEEALVAGGHTILAFDLDAADDRSTVRDRLAAQLGDQGLDGVLSLLAAAEEPRADRPELPAGVAGTVALYQALDDLAVPAPLWCLTRSAVAAAGSAAEPSPVQAMIWGLGRVAALESPERWGGLVEVADEPDEAAARTLLGVLGQSTGEDQVTVRGPRALARRLVQAPLPLGVQAPAAWRARGTVLVTGGTGAVGGHVARWLAGAGAEHIVLLSRRGAAAPGAADLQADLAALGAKATLVACDVADRAQLGEVLDRITAEAGQIRAVLHTAGVLHTGNLAEDTLDQWADTFRAKVGGAANLDELTAHLDLDAFVLFSSSSATWGSGGQSAYAAANAYLDGLARRRRARGLPATSVAWGAWADGGMSTGEGSQEYLERRGLFAMPAGSAVGALAVALGRDETELTVARMDWERFTASFTLRRPSPLLSAFATEEPEEAADDSEAARLRERLAGLSEAEQDKVLHELVRDAAVTVLGLAGPDAMDAIKPRRPFKEFGFDSLTALELRNRLVARTGLALPATLVFDHPTPAAVIAVLRAGLLQQGGPAGGGPGAELDRLEAALAEADLDEAERTRVAIRLHRLVSALGRGEDAGSGSVSQSLDEASDDDLFDLVDRDLGVS